MCAFECRIQSLSFFILAAATQKSSIILKQSNDQHVGGGYSRSKHWRKENTYVTCNNVLATRTIKTNKSD